MEQFQEKQNYFSTVFPPDQSQDKDCKLPELKNLKNIPDYGDGRLIVIPTANKRKVDLTMEVYGYKTSNGGDIHYKLAASDSNVGEQPYNQMGKVGARNRINNAIERFEKETDVEELKEKKIGSVNFVSMENYIRIDGARYIDYGMITAYNPVSGEHVESISKGVQFPNEDVEEARNGGFIDEEKLQGKRTAGSIMAEKKTVLKKDNPHECLAGVSRYDLLKEAFPALPN